MSFDNKLGILEALLNRVRKRAAGPHIAAAPEAVVPEMVEPLREEPAESPGDPIAALASEPPFAEPRRTLPPPPPRLDSGPPEIEALPLPVSEERAPSEPPGDDDDGPPSAPRLREGIAAQEEPEQDFPEDEAAIKTAPPESGRQHVAAAISLSESADELEAEIAITVTEGSPSPPPAGVSESTEPSSRREPLLPQVDIEPNQGPMPRLAFVSEPEIEFHVSRPLAAPSEVPAPPPPVAARAPSEPPPAHSSFAPPVRLMAQPAAGEGEAAPPPVEVWASTHAPSDIRGQVATFVGQNATFAPKSFGELLDASLALGES